MQKNKIAPIQSKQLLDTLALELRKKDESYYLISQLILETGMPLENIPKLTIKDITNNPISFQPSHKYVVRSEYISQQLLKSLKSYAGDKEESALAFHTLRDEGKPFPIQNFKQALTAVSKKLGLEPPINTLTLRKTYILNIFLKEHNYQKIYALTGCRSIKAVYSYLNLEAPAPDNKNLSGYTIKDAIRENKTLSKVQKHCEKVFNAIEDNFSSENGLSYEYCSEVMKLANDIDNALTRFEDLTGSPSVLKELYDRKK